MAQYAVKIKATIRKTYIVEADSEEQAIEEAQAVFSVLNEDDVEEQYDETIVSVVQVKSAA